LPKIICNTSPLQYLHQLNQLHLIPTLAGRIIIPPAVVDEIATGIAWGIDLPDLQALDWLDIQPPLSRIAVPLVTHLGPGETEVIMLAMELSDAVVILDDALARKNAELLGIRVTGTLGLLLDAKRAGLIAELLPIIEQLQALNFRLAPHTCEAVLKMAGER
jgi:predicted nucleic acid-binding protein